MNVPLYDVSILRLAATVPHLGRLVAPQGTAEKRSVVCGSRVTADIVLGANGRVADLGLDLSACALGQASANVMASHAVGRSPQELCDARDALAAWLAGDRDDPGGWPGLEQLARARSHSGRHTAIRLPFEAVAEAALKAGG